MSLVKGKNINSSEISFSTPKTLDNGAKLVYVNYKGGRFNIQTPWMTMPWKMGVFTDGEYPKYSIDMSFKGMESDPELQEFHDKFQALEAKIIEGGVENSLPWFKKKSASKEVVEAIFNPIITNALLDSLKIKDNKTNIIVQKKAINLVVLIFVTDGNQSLIVVDERELIDELNVDIAAERTPAITIPLNPTGIKLFNIKVTSLSFSICMKQSVAIYIREPINKKIRN